VTRQGYTTTSGDNMYGYTATSWDDGGGTFYIVGSAY
jgi:hypothetical protein